MSNELSSRYLNTPDAVYLVGKAVDNLRRMDEMIQDLLDVHRVSAGEPLAINRETCDLAELLRTIVENLTTIYGDRFALEEFGNNWSIDCDKRYLRRALENLCINAIKYGSEKTKVRLIVKALPKNGLSISVNNQGPAIAKSDHEMVFSIFKRGPVVDATKRGWGIGLTIVKGVVEAHGGKVSMESDPVSGTTFTIEIPGVARPRELSGVESGERELEY